MLRLVAGRVHEDVLRLLVGVDAENAVARRLRLARGDGDVRTDELVDQRRLADVRSPDDRNGTGPECHGEKACSNHLLRLLLGAFSSCARTPSAGACSSTRHSTVNVWSCASPSVFCTA